MTLRLCSLALTALTLVACDPGDPADGPADGGTPGGKADVIEDAELDFVRLHRSMICPAVAIPGKDCSGFIEVHAGGTLIYDEFGTTTVHNHFLTYSEFDEIRDVMANPELLDFLAASEEQPQSIIDERMTVVLDGVEYVGVLPMLAQNDAVAEARGILDALAIGKTTDFEELLVSTGGFCPPEVDCQGSLSISSDGTAVLDPVGGTDGQTENLEARLSYADLAAIMSTATRPELVELLGSDLHERCDFPTDISETMRVSAYGEEFHGFTLGCNDEPIETIRAVTRQIREDYFTQPEPEPELPSLQVGSVDDPGDGYGVTSARVEGDVLIMSVTHGGGCEEHDYTLNWDGLFLESFPVQVNMQMHHDANNDFCEALLSTELSFDLTPLRDAYVEGYQTEHGTIFVHLFGSSDSLSYEF